MTQNQELGRAKLRKLSSFKNCTESQDEALAKEFLERNSWDVDRAILEYFEEKGERKVVVRRQSSSTGMMGGIYNIVSSVWGRVYSYGKYFFKGNKKKDEIKDGINAFKNTFSDQCPDFHPLSFAKALKNCKAQRKLLFVYLHDSRAVRSNGGQDVINQNVFDFCRTVLTSNNIVEYVNQHFNSWMADFDSKDGHMISNQIGIREYPFVFIAIPSKANTWNNLYCTSGPITEMQLMTGLTESLKNYHNYLSEKTIEQMSIQDAKSLREQQDDEYQRMSQRDLINMEKESQDARQLELEEKMARQMAQKEKERKKKLLDSVPEEPTEEEPNVIVFIIALPNGSFLSRRFRETDKIQDIYNLVESIKVDAGDATEQRRVEFKVVSAFPRREYSEMEQTLAGAGFRGRVKLIVESKFVEE